MQLLGEDRSGPASSKLMMKMFRQVCKAKKDKTDADQEIIKMIGSSYDISDRKYIEPIVKCLEELSVPFSNGQWIDMDIYTFQGVLERALFSCV